jgi:hypothetical protein
MLDEADDVALDDELEELDLELVDDDDADADELELDELSFELDDEADADPLEDVVVQLPVVLEEVELARALEEAVEVRVARALEFTEAALVVVVEHPR